MVAAYDHRRGPDHLVPIASDEEVRLPGLGRQRAVMSLAFRHDLAGRHRPAADHRIDVALDLGVEYLAHVHPSSRTRAPRCLHGHPEHTPRREPEGGEPRAEAFGLRPRTHAPFHRVPGRRVARAHLRYDPLDLGRPELRPD